MDESFRWLGRTFGRLFLLWAGWYLVTVAIILSAAVTGLLDFWRATAVAALLIFSVVYGTVMLIRVASKELDRLPAGE